MQPGHPRSERHRERCCAHMIPQVQEFSLHTFSEASGSVSNVTGKKSITRRPDEGRISAVLICLRLCDPKSLLPAERCPILSMPITFFTGHTAGMRCKLYIRSTSGPLILVVTCPDHFVHWLVP